jgi:hypothetical protein
MVKISEACGFYGEDISVVMNGWRWFLPGDATLLNERFST